MSSDSKTPVVSPPGPTKTRRYTAILILVTLGVYSLCIWFPAIMALTGVTHYGVWFMDTYAILAAVDAQRLGLDPYDYNPLNHFGGPHVYSHWWLWLEHLGLTRAHTLWLGALISGLGLVTAWGILRPRTRRELACALVMLCSAPVVLGLNRANADLLLFVLLSLCVPCLLGRSRFWRITGVPVLVVLAMGLKFYPVVAGLIVLAVRPQRDRRLALLLLVALVIPVGLNIAPDLVHYQADRLPEGLYTFGATTALAGVGISSAGVLLAAGGFLALVGMWFVQRAKLRTWNAPGSLQTEYLQFILGAAILTGSFVLTVNYAYRWIYAVWMLPFLCRLEVPAASVFLRQWLTATRWLLLIVVSGEMLGSLALNMLLPPNPQPVMDRWGDLTNALLQPVHWLLFACLSGWLVHFIVTQLKSPPAAPAGGTVI